MRCPLCGSSSGKQIFCLCKNMKIMGRSFPEDPAYVAVCGECGLVYTDTEATQQDFLNYYKHGAVAPKYYDMFGVADTEDYYRHLLELMCPHMTVDARILDIAGSWGEFGQYLAVQGYEDVTVLDPNEACIRNAEKLGLQTVCADSTDMSDIADRHFDMVILNHTLEHILDLGHTMEEVRRILKDTGTVFIELPDIEGYADEDAAPFNFLTYEHVVHISLHDLENLASHFGFDIIDQGRYYKKVSNYPSIYAVMRKGTKRSLTFSGTGQACMEQYIEKSKGTLEKFLQPLRESGESLTLWGIGASTAILIDSFGGCNVKKLVDRNPDRQGIIFRINGTAYRVEPPENVGSGTIVILSIPYYDSIRSQIREMGLKNKIVGLK